MLTNKRSFCLVGAGLGNGLLAWFLRKKHPDVRVVIYESKTHIDTNRTWSFHKTDIGERCFEIITELIAHQWSGYDVCFPKFQKQFKTIYATLTPEKLQHELLKAGVDIQFSSSVQNIAEDHIVLADGSKQFYECIIDGRGTRPSIARLGFQKFVGQSLRLKKPHGLKRPLLMEATVPQIDGFRFFYILPWSEAELLVEDTRYSVSDKLNVTELKLEIEKYTQSRGWEVESVLKTESGVLPIPLEEDLQSSSIFRLGMAGGFFHPVTGYSLPDSVRLADRISSLDDLNRSTIENVLKEYKAEQVRRKKFYFLLNRMMFLAAADTERRKIFEHFYSLPQSVIERFYSGRTSISDGFRILSGKPPVEIGRALRVIVPLGKQDRL